MVFTKKVQADFSSSELVWYTVLSSPVYMLKVGGGKELDFVLPLEILLHVSTVANAGSNEVQGLLLSSTFFGIKMICLYV